MALAAGLVFAASVDAVAQETSDAPAPPAARDAPPIQGVFLLDPDAGDSVDEVIDRGVGLLAWYKRPFARGRLRDGTEPRAWVALDPGPEAIRVRTEADDLTIPWTGGLRDWEWKEGDLVDVTASWDGDDLLQDFHGSDGSRFNRYVLSSDGRTLELFVRIDSDQLKEALRYRLVYVRQR
ncbi:MAG TPA: hypothetical protein VK837_07320 [Longimicrobiales bacterium]|nr:hypothetical protein [Longimicrobiales bacterium]